jgi:hypothetical protein
LNSCHAGNTGNMLKAWRYFTSYDHLQTLVILNNDVTVVPGTFIKLHRCAQKTKASGVIGPMSNLNGVGAMHWQNAESVTSRRTYYNGLAAPKPLRLALLQQRNIRKYFRSS